MPEAPESHRMVLHTSRQESFSKGTGCRGENRLETGETGGIGADPATKQERAAASLRSHSGDGDRGVTAKDAKVAKWKELFQTDEFELSAEN